ncbi:Pentatricopeptide repeat [Arabidopsis thaliana x Arabidopsis arenosa]|uniref:Pentatricopeptide repeat n=1 Tax=Arabidopsis thaliana x Arabidopsis arenosa TaxID=1240361 RepID=A0A8T2AFP2_9BRAS|nr:Pentatricopeptide repeat [Arabidopsis thaliana x Arabidopsis arenosa]
MKKRIWRISLISQISDLLCLSRGSSSTLKTLTPFCFTLFRSPIHPPFKSGGEASALKTQLLRFCNDSDKVASVLESNKIQGAAFVELLRQLRPWPVLSQVVFDWRRNKALCDGVPMTADEYAKGITISGRLKNVDLALSLFNESAIKTTSLYNSLMGAYMWNGLADDCKQLFLDFNAQQEGHSSTPSVSTCWNLFFDKMVLTIVTVDFPVKTFIGMTDSILIMTNNGNNKTMIDDASFVDDNGLCESTPQIQFGSGLPLGNPPQANLTQHVMCTLVTEVNAVEENPKEWWYDTGATTHICIDKDMFCSYQKCKSEERLFMDMRKNLISGTLMSKAGFSIFFESDKLVLKKHGVFVGMGYVQGGLVKMNKSWSYTTYNILISLYGRLIMVDRMEAVFLQLTQLNFQPDSSTYNNLIAGYIYAWNWDKMEATFHTMKNGLVKPTLATYLLMLRGYANSGNLLRMEHLYQAVKRHVDRNEIQLIESMICAYYRSSHKDRIRKIKTLSKLIPKKSYKPWLYVLLIQVYAQDDNLHAMENFIDQAISKGLQIETDGIMRSIVASYFRCNAVDKLAKFMQRANSAGWKMSRSMFHGLMVMYGSQKRFKEMENVLSEMERFNISRSKKTLCILHRVYAAAHGQEHKVNQITGMMLKHGHDLWRREDYLKL